MSFKVSYATFSDKGERVANEDSIGVVTRENERAFFLCDGLGGHGMGDVASSLVVDVFKSIFDNENIEQNVLIEAFQAGQDILLAEQKARNAKKKMKTTATILAMDAKRAYIGHIGDSRVYVFNKNKVVKRTLDHSIPQMLVITGDIDEKDIRKHPDRNRVLRVMGTDWDEPQYDLMKPIPLKKCQAFILCSDGFWELVEEDVMCKILEDSSNVAEWLTKMVDEAFSKGRGTNMDNISAIAVWVEKN